MAPILADAGYRVLAPALRGFAPTRFREAGAPRSGQLSALGRDLLDFIDVLGLAQPALIGHDWGARAAANACGLRDGVASQVSRAVDRLEAIYRVRLLRRSTHGLSNRLSSQAP